jgi:hypothetical protein
VYTVLYKYDRSRIELVIGHCWTGNVPTNTRDPTLEIFSFWIASSSACIGSDCVSVVTVCVSIVSEESNIRACWPLYPALNSDC